MLIDLFDSLRNKWLILDCMWELQAALSNNPRQWENCYIIHLGSRKFKKKKGKAFSPSNWDLLFITSLMANFMIASVLNAEQTNILLTPSFLYLVIYYIHSWSLKCSWMYMNQKSHPNFVNDVYKRSWYFLLHFFSVCHSFKIHMFALKVGFSFEIKSPGKRDTLFLNAGNQHLLWQLSCLIL